MGYEVHGGPGSIRFSLTELERTTSMLTRTGTELLEGASFLVRFPQIPAAMLALGTMMLRARVIGAVQSLAEAAGSCTARAAEAGVLALSVATARSTYEQAESAAQRGMNEARGSLLPLTVMQDLANNKGRPRTQTTEDLINELPSFLGFPFGFLRDTEHGGVFQAPLADRLYPQLTDFLRSQNLMHLGPIKVRGQGPDRVMQFDGTIETLVELQKLAEREPPGSLLVTRFEGNDGPVYVMTIPGTQSDPLKNINEKFSRIRGTESVPELGNPWDGTGIVEGMGNDSKNLIPSIEEALRQSGANDGDRVVVTGYSQGGIHAVNIVNDEHLNQLFDFEYLATFGSPTGQVPVPEDTHALHLEDRNDLVPGTDGSRNPEERNRLTIVFDGPDGSIELGNDGFGEAHKLENYESHAKELRGSQDPGVIESLGLLGTLFGQSRRGKVRSLQLGRQPRPEMKPPKKDKKLERLSRITPGH
ncbi:hypothetical protein GCM10009715_36700 [Paeniglutamicibacter psychrophenolicus]|uniref:PE-PPE domain-containing protein n=1 Tax=Paeniglutamicibacter psychrophenolicus TaxID=257454 RepID=A0ABS4WAM2_9MICC|nr:hypothetical protein [Paeniglutamicibacter psychrophenolicus]MBP2373257.1 hypothetical protein [Paeniglutamicibacter psychrophenolicus]